MIDKMPELIRGWTAPRFDRNFILIEFSLKDE